jgi:2',3'-cyclic-nucleotide 2'-phosphodiesterase/3'-nucleotidase
MPGFHGSHLGVVDLVLAPSAAGWSVLSHRSEARPAARNTRDEPGQPYAGEDAEITALAAPSHLIARRRLSAPVGATDRALHSYFALARPAAALALVADAQREFVSEKIPAQFAGLPILSAVAPLKAGGRTGPKNYTDISAGPLALRHVEALCPYPNTLCAVISTGDEVASWLERSASIFRHISPGIAGQPLHVAHAQGYTFDALDGLTYEIDLSAKSGERRVRDIRFDGKPVRTEDRFIVATNNHRIAQGSLGKVVLASEHLTRDIVADHIRKLGVVSPTARDTWRLSRVPGASVTFTTGPGALPFLGKGEGLGMTALGPSTDGFVYVGFSL